MKIVSAKISPQDLVARDAIVAVALPDLDEVRILAERLHRDNQDWQGEAFGWKASYSKGEAKFEMGELGVWLFWMTWENGQVYEFLDDDAVSGDTLLEIEFSFEDNYDEIERKLEDWFIAHRRSFTFAEIGRSKGIAEIPSGYLDDFRRIKGITIVNQTTQQMLTLDGSIDLQKKI